MKVLDGKEIYNCVSLYVSFGSSLLSMCGPKYSRVRLLHVQYYVCSCDILLIYLQISPSDDIDFSLCECAARVIAQVDVRTVPAKLQPLVDHVMGSLCDALKNKLPSKQRQQTLKLLTALVQVRYVVGTLKQSCPFLLTCQELTVNKLKHNT